MVKNRSNVYQFNDFGNTISIKDNDGYAQYYKYLTSGTNKNKLSLESKLQKTVINLLKNHNAEFDRDWVMNSYDGSTASYGYDTANKYMGARSLKISKTNSLGSHNYYQSLNLTKGKTYTFSCYIKTSGITNANRKGAAISLKYQDSAGIW